MANATTTTRRSRTAVAAGAGLALIAGLTAAAGPAHAAANVCQSDVVGDVNGDGYAEVAISSQQPDAVHVFYGHPSGLQFDAKGSARNDQLFTQDTPGVPGSVDPFHAFGHATAFGDFNADGCADLAISAMYDSNGWGSVTVLYGSPKGLTATVQSIRPAGRWR